MLKMHCDAVTFHTLAPCANGQRGPWPSKSITNLRMWKRRWVADPVDIAANRQGLSPLLWSLTSPMYQPWKESITSHHQSRPSCSSKDTIDAHSPTQGVGASQQNQHFGSTKVIMVLSIHTHLGRCAPVHPLHLGVPKTQRWHGATNVNLQGEICCLKCATLCNHAAAVGYDHVVWNTTCWVSSIHAGLPVMLCANRAPWQKHWNVPDLPCSRWTSHHTNAWNSPRPGVCLYVYTPFPGHYKGAHHMVLNFSVKNSTSKSIHPLTVSKWMVPSAEHITVSASGIAASSSGDSNGAVTW